MKIAVGLLENRPEICVELLGSFRDEAGRTLAPGAYRFDSPIVIEPLSPDASFAIEGITIGIGFHWEREERQVFRGSLRVIRRDGLSAIHDVEIEDYVTSVISSEMSAACPLELLKAHAVISRSWLLYPRTAPEHAGQGNAEIRSDGEIVRWYGREAHENFDVCADDHCQRYQGITKVFSFAAELAVKETAGELLCYHDEICDARFAKCCGGWSENYENVWDPRDVPYLVSIYDGSDPPPPVMSAEDWILGNPPAWCNTKDESLLSQILPAFDRETLDFYRWAVEYAPDELGEIVKSRLGLDLGPITDLQPLTRGPSHRIGRLRIVGQRGSIIVGKELEIRRALSRSHLYSSAFIVQRELDRFVLKGAGWGHGVGLCQIGAAVMASKGKNYREILGHYYPGAGVKPAPTSSAKMDS